MNAEMRSPVVPILMVDDRPENLVALEALLSDQGYELVKALSGNEALRLTLKQDFALVLLDVQMPEMDGFETAELMRKNPKTRQVPIIFVTAGMQDLQFQFKGYDAGAVDCLIKPLEPRFLQSKVRVFADLYSQRREIEMHKIFLEQMVRERTAELRTTAEDLKASNEQLLVRNADLREREEFIRNVLETVDEGFIIIDREYRILSANRAYANMIGMPMEKIVGRHCYEVSHHVPRPCFENSHECAIQQVFETGKSHTALHVHHDAKGGATHIETKGYPLGKDGSGRVVTAIETLVDISEKQKLEEQLRQSQKMEAIGQLAGGIAHDFNNILTAIIGYGNIALMKMEKDAPLRRNIDNMLEAADRAAHLTQDLLLFSRKQAGDRKPVDLNTVIRKVEKFLSRVIGEDVECRATLVQEPLPVLGDSHQLEQVLVNLATNARDAMSTGGIFTISTQPVTFDEEFMTAHGYGKPGAYALTTISDTGKGMDADTREHIFEPFFTTKEAGKGTGLGLAVVYGIIRQHDGFVNVYSEPGQGTTFKLYLPSIADPVVEKSSSVEERPLGGTETILLAEDDDTVRELTKLVLEDSGYTVITAIDGQDAVNKYRENKDRVHLLLFDLVMPKKTGKDAYEEIRAVTPGVKVLFASGYAPDIVRHKVLLDDNTPVVFKPLSPTKLLKLVREGLDR